MVLMSIWDMDAGKGLRRHSPYFLSNASPGSVQWTLY